MVIFSMAQLVAARTREPLLLQTVFPENNPVQHLWPILAVTGLWSFPWPLVLGLAMLASGRRAHSRGAVASQTHPLDGLDLGGDVGSIRLVCLLDRRLPFHHDGREAGSWRPKFPRWWQDQHVTLQSDPHADVNARLEDISEQIITLPAELIKRDLIITASRLPAAEAPRPTLKNARDNSPRFVEANLMPEDLYFYYDGNSGKHVQPPAQEPRFIPLRQNPTKLFPVVIGSSTIYPIFAPETLENIDLGRNRAGSG